MPLDAQPVHGARGACNIRLSDDGDVSQVLPAVIAALISGVIAVVVAFLTIRADTRRQTGELRQQLEAESKRREHEFEVEGERRRHALELQEERLRVELRTEYMAEAAIAQMLWKAEPLRSFARIKERIGGFDDDELRRLLVRAGALRFTSNDGKPELWGLRDRNEP